MNKLMEDLLTRASSYIDKERIQTIGKALSTAMKYAGGIKDVNGDDYFLHVLRSAIILTELHSDEICIACSLLGWIPSHVEGVEAKDFEAEFGQEVVNIVESLHKINKLKLKDDSENQAIYFRKALVGLSTDVRVIIIKLATRLDNLKNVYTTPSPTQKAKCLETESVLIPIAHRLGINYIKSELENLCLKYLKPDIYEEILGSLDSSYEELNGYIDEMKRSLSEMMIENGIKFRIKGRVKSVHSLYEKLAKGKRWSDIYDILALRIIVEKKSECYLAIGLIHSKYRPIPKRFKDYIAQPKENMYQSLHTGVIGPDGKVFEIQIRTEEMDEIAECGIASHWSYKEHGTKAIQSLMEQKLELFRGSMELGDSEEEAIDELKEAFVDSMIYVFTPNGDAVELPEGSTPVDFAYRIHSHVGDTLVGAIVNDQIVPIDYQLQNDDIVKINTNENMTPKKEWLKFVKTSQAKNKIKAFFNRQDKANYIERGEELITKEIKKRHWNVTDTLSNENVEKLLGILKLRDLDELKLAVGSMRYTANYVMSLLVEEKQNAQDLILEKINSKTDDVIKNYKSDIIVEGCDDVLVTVANCCKPVHGDEIIGYITKGNGIVVHKTNCANIKNMESRFIDVTWNETSSNVYTADILIRTNNIGNNVLDIVAKCTERGLSLSSLETIERGNEIDYELLIKVPDAEKLNLFMLDIEALDFVTSVERVVK